LDRVSWLAAHLEKLTRFSALPSRLLALGIGSEIGEERLLVAPPEGDSLRRRTATFKIKLVTEIEFKEDGRTI